MKRKSLIEEILETAIKNPASGVIIGVFFFGSGLYLTNKQAHIPARPDEIIFLPMIHLFGIISYILSVLVLLLAGIGYLVTSNKRKKVVVTENKVPKFETKEEYFRWKETELKKSSDSDDDFEFPSLDKEETMWTLDSIYDALGKIDWYQFEKFSATLLSNEGYTVERKGGAQPDGGVDLIATKNNDTILVQCKHWKTWEIKPKTVREMIGTMKINQTTNGAIYTLKGASAAALGLAAQQGILIEEGHGLSDRALRQLSKEQLDSILNTNMHHCPKCEAEMVWREGNFKSFWGCSRYPKCRGKLEYTGAR